VALFSIITITLNNLSGLKKTAHSISSQTLSDYEWIVVDGASKDGTLDFLTELVSTNWISEPDDGLYHAMNKGIDKATGQYIIFMNAGDCFSSCDVLEKITPLTHSQPDFIYGDSVENNHYKRARHHQKINWGMFTHHQSMIYNRPKLGNMRYNTEYHIASDYDLTLRFLKHSQEINYLNYPICIFETGGLSQKQARLGRNEQFLIRHRNQSQPLVMNVLIYLGQFLRMATRTSLPKIYWSFLTSRNTSKTGSRL
jgi:putative colanic acid biosynthesis glycosyltransferase